MQNKRADLEISYIIKIIVAIVVLVTIIVISIVFKDFIYELAGKFNYIAPLTNHFQNLIN